MASNYDHVITIDNLASQPVPTYRLRGPPPPRSRPTHSGTQSLGGWLNVQWDFMAPEGWEVTEEGLVTDIDEAATREATERNAARIKKVFEDLHKQLEKQENEVLVNLESLTPTQQEDAVMFWQGVQGFLMDILRWLQMQFNLILEKLRNGWRLVKETVREIFKKVKEAIKDILKN